MKIAIFTDTHLGYNRETSEVTNSFGKDVYNYLKKITENTLKDIKYVFFLGDMVDVHSENIKGDFEFLKKTFEDKKIYGVYGNNETFIEKNKNIDIASLVDFFKKDYVIIDNSIRIFLKIEKKERNNIYVEDEKLERLESLLSMYSDLEKNVYMHYPVTEDMENVSYYHKNRITDCFPKKLDRVREILKKYNVKNTFSGHTHFFYQKNIDGTLYTTIPSFSENENGKPNLKFAILDTVENTIEIV